MSAIDTTFHFVRNPTAINGLQTTYVSKRGSDVSGDGTAQNPYASLAKATSVATNGTNIMLDDGEWDESPINNGRVFKWYGNSNTNFCNTSGFTYGNNTEMHNFTLIKNARANQNFYIYESVAITPLSSNYGSFNGKRTIFIDYFFYNRERGGFLENCVVINPLLSNVGEGHVIKNSIFININSFSNINTLLTNCNFTTSAIPSTALNSINDTTTGQTFADYFNKYDASDWLKCDFTAKEGSKNIGAGEKGTTIGFNQGYTMYADNSTNDMFSPSNGATLKNIEWDSNLNGYTLVQKERICQGATSTTITLDSSASSVDDYYNNLFVGIVAGDGYGEIFKITDYDGGTKTATIDGTWNTIPTTNSIYTISGTILSAVKDFGKAIKVKRNWTFADNFTALTDGQWAEFMTNVEANGKQFPVSCYSYEYSTDGVNFVQGQTADDLVSATNGENKVTDNIYGDCSPNYNEATAKNLVMRYIRVRVHIGFNI